MRPNMLALYAEHALSSVRTTVRTPRTVRRGGAAREARKEGSRGGSLHPALWLRDSYIRNPDPESEIAYPGKKPKAATDEPSPKQKM